MIFRTQRPRLAPRSSTRTGSCHRGGTWPEKTKPASGVPVAGSSTEQIALNYGHMPTGTASAEQQQQKREVG